MGLGTHFENDVEIMGGSFRAFDQLKMKEKEFFDVDLTLGRRFLVSSNSGLSLLLNVRSNGILDNSNPESWNFRFMWK